MIEEFDVLALALNPPQTKPSWLGFVLSDAQYELGITAQTQLSGAPSYSSIESDVSGWEFESAAERANLQSQSLEECRREATNTFWSLVRSSADYATLEAAVQAR